MRLLDGRMNPTLMLIIDITIIFLLSSSTFYLLKEIKLVKEQGGPCINNPTGWAMQYAKEKYNETIDCSCTRTFGGLYSNTNFSKVITFGEYFNHSNKLGEQNGTI